MKMAYDMTRLTPLKVVYSRMPPEFGQFSTKIDELDKMLTLPQETAVLIRQRAAGINVCSFCIDIGRHCRTYVDITEDSL